MSTLRDLGPAVGKAASRHVRGARAVQALRNQRNASAVASNDTSRLASATAFSSTNTSVDVTAFDPVDQAQGRKNQLPPSRYGSLKLPRRLGFAGYLF